MAAVSSPLAPASLGSHHPSSHKTAAGTRGKHIDLFWDWHYGTADRNRPLTRLLSAHAAFRDLHKPGLQRVKLPPMGKTAEVNADTNKCF